MNTAEKRERACPKTESRQGDFMDNSNNNMKSWKGKYEPKVPLTTPYILERRNGLNYIRHLFKSTKHFHSQTIN